MAILALCLWATGTPADETQAADPLFETSDRIDLVIEAPWSTFMRHKPRDEDLAGKLRLSDADDTGDVFDVDIRARGHSRNDWCDFPPVLVNFRRSQTEDTLFANQNKLKLVVHCKMPSQFEQIVLKEFLVYRMLNVLTDRSFRVRLLRVTYVDSDAKKNDVLRYAFLIEHKQRLAQRLGKDTIELERANISDIQPAHLNIASIFAFMVGNTDFSPIIGPGGECCHNYVLFSNGVDPILAIPYDFDQSGVVDAPYAQPNQKFGIRTVKQRVYRGRCTNNAHVPATLERFRDRKQEIFGLIDEQEGLHDSTRRRVRSYIEKFYGIIDNPRTVQRRIIDNCI